MQPFLDDIATLAKPSLYNIYFAAASIPLGFVLAVALALVRASRSRIGSSLAGAYIYAFRGSPLFIQLFMFYSLALSLNISVWKPNGLDWLVLHPLFLGTFVLALNTTAYSAEIFYGALKTLPRGEIEAARAFGLSRFQTFRAVVWPNMLRLAWPAYTNEVVFLFHATTLVYFTLPVINEQKDLMNKAGELFERDYNAFLHFSVAALYFLAISLAIFFLSNLVYRRLMHHLGPAEAKPRVRFAPKYLR
ncbi:MAG: ABC transporter permease subunit [Alphaproteobacteria bacterium]|nr:ABC transporter permease subunit [Alphaproteobacteria bacterium]